MSFYQAKECCFYPYALLQSLRLENDRLTLTYSVADVLLQGRNLHPLFALLATQRVARIISGNLADESVVPLRDGRVIARRCEPARMGGRTVRVWSFRDITAEVQALRARVAALESQLAA